MKNRTEENGKVIFTGGKASFAEASATAENCPHFREDCEDELYCDDEISCYNCRYRRWTQTSFECIKRGDSGE